MRIRIISIPQGTPPIWVRKAMDQLVFTVIEEANILQYAILKNLTEKERARAKEEAYFVATTEIIRAIKEKGGENKDVLEWLEGIQYDAFIFLKIYCRKAN